MGVERNPTQAANWFRRSALQGNAYGQHSLGQLYRIGVGVEKNLVLAYAWLARSARGGDPDAGDERDAVAKLLKPAELVEAKRLEAAWKPGAAMEQVAPKAKK